EEVNKIANYNLNEEDLIENINVEFELNEDVVNLNLVEELHKLEPFGLKNPNPRFIVRNAILKEKRNIGNNNQHLKFKIEKDKVYDCIGFNMAYLGEGYSVGDKVDVLFQLDENNFRGNRTVQFLLKDMRLAHPKSSHLDVTAIELSSKIPPEENNLYTIHSANKEGICNKFEKNEINKAIEGDMSINVFNYIKENTLIITNTINGFYRAISDISLTDIEFDINYNLNDNNQHKVQLIFSPNIDKVDLKRYNNIILYDYLYNLGEYSYLCENMNKESLIIKYYSQTDLLYLNNIINNLLPTREEFIFIYKMAMSQSELMVKIVDIKKTFNIIPLKVFTILKVFKELDLLDFTLEEDINPKEKHIIISLLPKPDKKLNLDESKILNNLRYLHKQYQESY
ncbi:MAG: single-stranded-DNA-specific exonuclease RecJ, partial [Romboutsia sp.]